MPEKAISEVEVSWSKVARPKCKAQREECEVSQGFDNNK